ncbi:hypothetical protein LIQ52_03830 [Mitsuokella jalaludinii]|uniref:hypothetical protein n=1 Tax=Mitsuokella jalaludinii TaxID=187979 RepID=UPI001D01FC47|nr:hypothetical protein [Mitsuokella jalaludinii]MCB5724458.1 hypothetical protein [Mitsuokella jalaludinii]
MMNANQISKVNNLMERQLEACKAILTVVDEYEKQGLSAEDVKSAELQQLKDYTGDMLLACSTTQKLTKAISEAIEKAKKEKAAAAKAAKKAKAEEKKAEAEPVKVTGQKEEPAETTETLVPDEDDDLSWLE